MSPKSFPKIKTILTNHSSPSLLSVGTQHSDLGHAAQTGKRQGSQPHRHSGHDVIVGEDIRPLGHIVSTEHHRSWALEPGLGSGDHTDSQMTEHLGSVGHSCG